MWKIIGKTGLGRNEVPNPSDIPQRFNIFGDYHAENQAGAPFFEQAVNAKLRYTLDFLHRAACAVYGSFRSVRHKRRPTNRSS